MGVYGGYFGAGIGILMLAVLGAMGLTNIHQMNGLKNLGALVINAVAAALFAVSGIVRWPIAIAMAVGGLVGGYGGAVLAQRVPQIWVRRAITGVGLMAFVWLLVAALTWYNPEKARPVSCGRAISAEVPMKRRDFLRCGATAAGAFVSLNRFPHHLYAADVKKTPQDLVTLGKTGIKVSRLAQGTGTNGVNHSSNQIRQMGDRGLADLLVKGVDNGLHFWDLADQVRQPSAREARAADRQARQGRDPHQDPRQHRAGDARRSRSVPHRRWASITSTSCCCTACSTRTGRRRGPAR